MDKEKEIMRFMLRQLSSSKYGYRDVIEGCYDVANRHFEYSNSDEVRKTVVDEVIKILNNSIGRANG